MIRETAIVLVIAFAAAASRLSRTVLPNGMNSVPRLSRKGGDARRSTQFAAVLIAIGMTIPWQTLTAADAANPPSDSLHQPPSDTLRQADNWETLLLQTAPSVIAGEAELRGDPGRGALIFYRSAAACANCHGSGDDTSPLGPDLAVWPETPTPAHLVESILYPERHIRAGYETALVLKDDGQVISGLVVRQDDRQLVLRDASDLLHEIVIDRDDIETLRHAETSMMPRGLVPAIGGQAEFYDLVRFLIEISRPEDQGGGAPRLAALKPDPQSIAWSDDTQNLDHAGIIRKLGKRDFEAGQAFYHGYCNSCHGDDGNTPSQPTARAFGTQTLKFGDDPYRMFLTLSRGNGLMAPMGQMTPKERYQVIHYIREAFIKPAGRDQTKVDTAYLASLPQGSDLGDRVLSVQRDYGPALASQLGREVTSALTVRLGDLTASYDLHRMNLAAVWSDGFLDLDQTQHIRGRGEGTPLPAGPVNPALSFWRWGHGGTLDYPTDGLLPRGPLPAAMMDYHGHYLHGDRLVLSYAIDGREVLESATAISSANQPTALVQTLHLGPGASLSVAIAQTAAADGFYGYAIDPNALTTDKAADKAVTTADGQSLLRVDGLLFAVTGDRDGVRWEQDDQRRVVLHIPADQQPRLLHVMRQQVTDHPSPTRERGTEMGVAWASRVAANEPLDVDPQTLTVPGPRRWDHPLQTTGYWGLQPGGYALDTLPVPRSTPWNTWFRTSAIDFFDDGRMVVTTYGGDVWIVSGVDDQLLELRWQRFAGGLYEPMGVKVIDNQIYVTGKDRITRLHDKNGDGEADFYESFAADFDVSIHFHAFAFDLQVDDDGFLYYAKSGHGSDMDLPGAIVRLSPDGKQREIYATGFRVPNGMGAMPGGRLVASDNQGQWTPASKINLLRPGGFYGWVQTYNQPGKWSPGGGAIDITQVKPPSTFDRPLIYMPQILDNSSGGQLWVDDPRWGPLSGRLLHTSFGRGWMMYLMLQDVDDVTQAAMIKLPFDFLAGIQRAAVNPVDGQVYAVGLDGWNGGGRHGLIDHGIQRLRYTGQPYPMVTDCQVEAEGLRLSFNFPLLAADESDGQRGADDPASYLVRQWNYKWQAAYGSEMYSPQTGEVGIDVLPIQAAEIAEDRRSVLLRSDALRAVDQVQIRLAIPVAVGGEVGVFEEEIYWTVNRVPGRGE